MRAVLLDRRAIRRRVDGLDRPTPAAGRQVWWLRLDVVASAVAGGVVVASALGIHVAAVLAAGAVAARFWWQRYRVTRRARQRQAQIPEALERLAAALRSGSSLSLALAEAGRGTPEPLGPELAGLARDASHGQPLLAVLDGWTAQHDDTGTRLAATALALAARVGAAPARAVDGVAATLRERLELAAERRALATQARTSATALVVAPLLFALLLGVSDGAAGRFLLRTPEGWICLVAGVGLDLIGALWMRRLTEGDVTGGAS